MKLVAVAFYDPTTFNGWTPKENAYSVPLKACYAAGWLLPKQNKKDKTTRVALVTVGDGAEFNGIVAIPDGAILNTVVVKEVRIDK